MASPKLTWKKRGKKRETDVSTIWRWESTCGQYAIERHIYKVTMPEAWFSMLLALTHGDNPTWKVISNRHHTRQGAERACQLHHRAQYKS